jgi:hypothetical protein
MDVSFDLNKMLKRGSFYGIASQNISTDHNSSGKNWKSFFKELRVGPNIIKIIAENLICRNIKTKKAVMLSSLIIRKEQ